MHIVEIVFEHQLSNLLIAVPDTQRNSELALFSSFDIFHHEVYLAGFLIALFIRMASNVNRHDFGVLDWQDNLFIILEFTINDGDGSCLSRTLFAANM